MSRRGRGKRGTTIQVDFTGVKGSNRVPEGEYVVAVKQVDHKISDSSGKPYLLWQFEIVEGTYRGKTLYHNTSLQPQALFNLRNTLEALGIEVQESAMSLDLASFVGLEAGVAVEMESYGGRDRSRVVDLFHASELTGEGDDGDEYEDGDDGGDDEAPGDEEEENVADDMDEDEAEGDDPNDDDDGDEEDGDDDEDDDGDDDDEDPLPLTIKVGRTEITLVEDELKKLKSGQLRKVAEAVSEEFDVDVDSSLKKSALIQEILDAVYGDDGEDEDL